MNWWFASFESPSVLKIDVVSASHGAPFRTRCWNTLLSPKTIPNTQSVSILDEEAQLVARRVTNDEISRCNSGRGFLDEEQPLDDARSGNKWLCKAEMETRFGVRLTSAMLDNGNMKNMLCFATSMGQRYVFVVEELYPTPHIHEQMTTSNYI